MKVTRTTGAVMLAAGALTVLGFAGTALADGSDDTRARTAASASPSPDDSITSSLDDSVSASPGASATASPDSSRSTGVSPSSSATSSSAIKITAAQAKTIALRAAGGGRIESIERDREHGRLVWDVDVIRNGIEHDIDVDATTGEVTRHRTDDDRDDDRGRGSDD